MNLFALAYVALMSRMELPPGLVPYFSNTFLSSSMCLFCLVITFSRSYWLSSYTSAIVSSFLSFLVGEDLEFYLLLRRLLWRLL